MKLSVNSDQHYALNSEGKLIWIKNALRNVKFTCINCGGEMIAKQGKVREWHFAHKSLSENCSYESYLHSLAKKKIHDWFYHSDKILISLNVLYKCSESKNCLWYNPKTFYYCQKEESKQYNLKDYYNSCDIERSYKNFRADLFLYNSQSNKAPIFIEIFVKHQCEPEKIKSGIRIIELIIKSEEDIESVVNSTIEESNNIRLYNFKNKTEFTNSIKKPLEKFVLYKSAKGFCLNTDCRNYDEHNSDSVLEIIIGDNDYHTGYSIYELGLAIAYKRNYPVRSCYLCKYHKSSYDIYADNRPIFCCLYKKLGMDKYCKSTKAWECNAFRADKVLCNDIIEKYNRSYTEVWEKERTSIRKI